jgi:hypothetical protein
MDKRVYLKKAPVERKKCKTALPVITYEEMMYYIKCHFISVDLTKEEEIISNTIASELRKKQNSYKRQDIDKKKYNEQSFIQINEIYEKMLESNMKCYYCREKVCIFYNEVRQPNQWTLERIDNMLGHSSKNTVIACLDCNLKRRDKNSNAFQFAKQLVIKKI